MVVFFFDVVCDGDGDVEDGVVVCVVKVEVLMNGDLWSVSDIFVREWGSGRIYVICIVVIVIVIGLIIFG